MFFYHYEKYLCICVMDTFIRVNSIPTFLLGNKITQDVHIVTFLLFIQESNKLIMAYIQMFCLNQEFLPIREDIFKYHVSIHIVNKYNIFYTYICTQLCSKHIPTYIYIFII